MSITSCQVQKAMRRFSWFARHILMLMATIREVLGSGTWLGFQVLPDSVARIGIMTQAPGAFFCYGILMAGCVWLEGKLDARIERKSCCDIDNLKKEG